METTLLTLTFFAPVAAMMAVSLLTPRTAAPEVLKFTRRAAVLPLPPARSAAPAGNDAQYLQAA